MSHADNVRDYCIVNYVDPARHNGERYVEIKAGDVHHALNYRNRFPLVCSALGSNTFEATATVRRVSIEGPLNGSNTIFRFELLKG